MTTMSDFESIFSGIESFSQRKNNFDRYIGEWLYKYFSEMSKVEDMCEEYFNGGREDQSLNKTIRLEKQRLFEKYWSNQSDYYRPRGLSSVKRHSWDKVSEIEAIQNHDDANRLVVCRYVHDGFVNMLLLKIENNQIYIEHSFD